MDLLEENMHTLWKFHSEQRKLEEPSLGGRLLLLQLNNLHHFLRVWKLFPVQIEVVA
jgi:hypothetical protein